MYPSGKSSKLQSAIELLDFDDDEVSVLSRPFILADFLIVGSLGGSWKKNILSISLSSCQQQRISEKEQPQWIILVI